MAAPSGSRRPRQLDVGYRHDRRDPRAANGDVANLGFWGVFVPRTNNAPATPSTASARDRRRASASGQVGIVASARRSIDGVIVAPCRAHRAGAGRPEPGSGAISSSMTAPVCPGDRPDHLAKAARPRRSAVILDLDVSPSTRRSCATASSRSRMAHRRGRPPWPTVGQWHQVNGGPAVGGLVAPEDAVIKLFAISCTRGHAPIAPGSARGSVWTPAGADLAADLDALARSSYRTVMLAAEATPRDEIDLLRLTSSLSETAKAVVNAGGSLPTTGWSRLMSGRGGP